jgi:hypothetical protein
VQQHEASLQEQLVQGIEYDFFVEHNYDLYNSKPKVTSHRDEEDVYIYPSV